MLSEAFEWLDRVYREAQLPDPSLTVSEWADKYRHLPPTASEPGPWKTSRVPYLRDIMDALSTTSPIERVVFMKGVQLGATECGLNWLGYIISYAPGIAMLVMPSVDMVRRNTRTRIDPMINSTPLLNSKVAPARSRDAENTAISKSFPGGVLVMTGANSTSPLRSTPVRFLMCDEVDAYPMDVDGEGDPVALAIARTSTFRGRRKIYLVSTPTISGVSRIEKAFHQSDQRKFYVPCPFCKERQVLEWRNVKWDGDDYAGAYYQCDFCEERIEEYHKPQMLEEGEWRATAKGDGRTAGFHVSSLYSQFESWGEIAVEFQAAKNDPSLLKSWVNMKLGEAYEDRDTAPIFPDILQKYAEEYLTPDTRRIPDEVLVITAGVDTQNDRLEVEYYGVGLGEESWRVDYEIIHGDTSRPEVWNALDESLRRKFVTKSGRVLPVSATAIDSGGQRTDQVMTFCAPRANRRIWAIKGRGGPGVPPWPKRPPKIKGSRVAPVYIVGVDTLKATLMARLRESVNRNIEREKLMQTGRVELPPVTGPAITHLDITADYDWFVGLVSERAIRTWKNGIAKIEWLKDPNVRNEPLDCRVYAMAALHGLYSVGFRFERVDRALKFIPPPDVLPTISDGQPVVEKVPATQYKPNNARFVFAGR